MDHSAYIDAAAATLGLNLTQEQRKGVAAVLRPGRVDGRAGAGPAAERPPTSPAMSSCRWHREVDE